MNAGLAVGRRRPFEKHKIIATFPVLDGFV